LVRSGEEVGAKTRVVLPKTGSDKKGGVKLLRAAHSQPVRPTQRKELWCLQIL